ncbi:MAG: hypothetical protein CSB15_01335 [Clostridiales bacterium]|nr:MAG: hypothetical protein CSB15_01335 [Clostridiales bacterium]
MKKTIIFIMLFALLFTTGCSFTAVKKVEKKEEKQESKKKEEKQENEKKDENNKEDKSQNKTPNVGAFNGDKAIGFSLKTLADGKEINLNEYLGKKPIIIKFFASWCGPCRHEIPELKKINDEYEKKGLKVLAVNLTNGDKLENVKALIAENKVKFPVLLDESGKVAISYSIRSIPVNIFIDKNGIIKNRSEGMLTFDSYKKFTDMIMK